MKMRNLLESIINIPTNDPEDSRRRRLLNILLIGVAFLPLPLIPLSLAFGGTLGLTQTEAIIITVMTIVVFISCGILYAINRYISGRVASILFLVFLSVIFIFADTPQELSNGRSLILFTIPVVFSSILLTSTSSFVFALLGSIQITLLAFSIDILPNTPAMAGLMALALVSWLSSQSLEKALRDLRTININLDKIVTERTYALAEALGRERIEAGRNQAILNSIADGVVVFNANNMALLVNPALSHLTEMSLQSLNGINLREFTQAKGLTPTSKKMLLETIQNPDEIATGARIEWGKKTLSLSIARVQDTLTNESIGTVAVFRDITYEAELEKMKSTFVGVVSHELRTPLNAIIGYAEMLKESIYGVLNEKQASVNERIMINTRRLLAMVGDLLDEAQMKAGKLSIKKQVFKTSSLLENMHATMDQITTDKGLYLTDEFDTNMPETIVGDPQRLQQIVVNLINNAVKFTGKGGIHVRISRSDNDTNHWQLEVADTGMGIPEQEIPYIFETFRQIENSTTREQGGFGLGLSIVKQLVELMDGQITVKSNINKGSTFTIDLPFIIEKDK